MNTNSHSDISATSGQFANTRWSLVLHRKGLSGESGNALGELAQHYGYPVYAYLRCSGHSPEIAREMTQVFLQHLVIEFEPRNDFRPPAHYREFLLERLHSFLGGNWRETIEEPPDVAIFPLPSDIETRYAHDHNQSRSADQAFQRSFALEVLFRALARLREEATQTGRLDMFAALEPYLSRDPLAGELVQLAGLLQMRSLVLLMALKRLRQRLRELTGEELADTVGGADYLAAEQETLLNVLRGRE